jgi:hypothetical protein
MARGEGLVRLGSPTWNLQRRRPYPVRTHMCRFVLCRDARENVVLDFFLWDAICLSADLLRRMATIFDDGVFCRRARCICMDFRRSRSCRISVGLSHLAARHLHNWLFILLLGRSLSGFLFSSALLHPGASSSLSVRWDSPCPRRRTNYRNTCQAQQRLQSRCSPFWRR